MMHEWWSDWGHPGWGGMWFGPLIWLFLFGLLIVGVVALLRRSGNLGDVPRSRSQTPREILDERFAKGEIDKDEYEDRRKTLGG